MALDNPHAAPPGDEPTARRPDTDEAQLVGDERLPCGRLVSHAWQQARAAAPDHADPHMADCPYCRQAAEGLTALDRATRTLRAEGLTAGSVADRVIHAVRAEARLGRMLPLDDPERELQIAETPAARVLRQAADHVPGVRAASCRLHPDELGSQVAIAMTLAVALDHPLPGRAAQVRHAVAYAARQQLGLAVSAIDLTIVSVLEPREPAASTAPSPTDGGSS
jgi:hypothetical protein